MIQEDQVHALHVESPGFNPSHIAPQALEDMAPKQTRKKRTIKID